MGVCSLLLGWEIWASGRRLKAGWKSPRFFTRELRPDGTARSCCGQQDPGPTQRSHPEGTATQDRRGRSPAGRAGRGWAGGRGVRTHRLRVPGRGAEDGQRSPASQRGEPEKKGPVGWSVTCPDGTDAAKFHSYQQRRLLTGAWGGAGAAGLLLLRPLQAELPAL